MHSHQPVLVVLILLLLVFSGRRHNAALFFGLEC